MPSPAKQGSFSRERSSRFARLFSIVRSGKASLPGRPARTLCRSSRKKRCWTKMELPQAWTALRAWTTRTCKRSAPSRVIFASHLALEIHASYILPRGLLSLNIPTKPPRRAIYRRTFFIGTLVRIFYTIRERNAKDISYSKYLEHQDWEIPESLEFSRMRGQTSADPPIENKKQNQPRNYLLPHRAYYETTTAWNGKKARQSVRESIHRSDSIALYSHRSSRAVAPWMAIPDGISALPWRR